MSLLLPFHPAITTLICQPTESQWDGRQGGSGRLSHWQGLRLGVWRGAPRNQEHMAGTQGLGHGIMWGLEGPVCHLLWLVRPSEPHLMAWAPHVCTRAHTRSYPSQ